MIRWLVGLFFIVHGFIHGGVWFTRQREGAPFDPARSWLLSAVNVGDTGQQMISINLAAVVAVGFVVAGIAWLADLPWAGTVAFWSAALSLGLLVLFYNVWLSAAVLIDLAILYLVRR